MNILTHKDLFPILILSLLCIHHPVFAETSYSNLTINKATASNRPIDIGQIKELSDDLVVISADSTDIFQDFHVDNGDLVDVFSVDSVPIFPGGELALLEYIRNSIKYPEDALNDSICGRSVVQFIVEIDGSVSNPEIFISSATDRSDTVNSSIFKQFDIEAIRVISDMPKWSPGKHDGKLVRVKYLIPVSFRL